MTVSLIIPSLNAPTLAHTLAAIAAQTVPPDEVLVVGRDEAGIVPRFPGVRFVDTTRPVCAARARNIGMDAAQGEVFVFTDSDCLPHADWLARLLDRHRAGERVVGGAVVVKNDNYWTRSDNVSMFHEFVPQSPAGARRFLPSLNLLVNRAVVDEVGGMDESFPGAAAEDTDWTIRMRRAGVRLYFEPAALVRHAPARTTWPDVVRHWRNLGRNAIRVRLRYADEFNTPGFVRRPWLLRLLAPLIAVPVTARIYARPGIGRFWSSLPVVYVTKILYSLSAARAIASGEADR